MTTNDKLQVGDWFIVRNLPDFAESTTLFKKYLVEGVDEHGSLYFLDDVKEQNFAPNYPYEYDIQKVVFAEQKPTKKFQEGDKVVVVKDTPLVPEGWIGYVTSIPSAYGYNVHKAGYEDQTFSFEEHELELLSTSNSVKTEAKPQSALDKQVSGNHYKDCGIQPIEYIHANGLSYLEGNVIKYTTRHSKKNGKADIEKAIHYLELILEMEYKGETN